MSTLTQFFDNFANSVPVELLLIGGGGGGGGVVAQASISSGGGGAGQLIYCEDLPIKKGIAHAITVGGGGLGGVGTQSGSAGTSSLLENIEAFGGGGGAGINTATANTLIAQSAMGGGGGGAGGTGLTGGLVRAGNSQGAFYTIESGRIIRLGLASPGADGALNANAGGRGGSALGHSAYSSSITGTAVAYGLGGTPTTGNTPGFDGTASTGDGGGGCSNGAVSSSSRAGGNGGSGIVIIAYPNTYPVPTTITGTYTEPTRSGWRVYRFTGSGSITL